MRNRAFLGFREMRAKPRDQSVHLRHIFGFRRLILRLPACELPCAILHRLAEIAQPERLIIHCMQRADHLEQRGLHRLALRRRQFGHQHIGKHAPLEKFHHIEFRADHLHIGAVMQHLGHRHRRAQQGLLNAVFAVDLMRGGQQYARRFFTQHGAARYGFQQVSRVRLPALELADAQCAFHPLNMPRQIFREPTRIQPVCGQGLDQPGRAHANWLVTVEPPSTTSVCPVI